MSPQCNRLLRLLHRPYRFYRYSRHSGIAQKCRQNASKLPVYALKHNAMDMQLSSVEVISDVGLQSTPNQLFVLLTCFPFERSHYKVLRVSDDLLKWIP
jgi:hypothetical protein